MKSLVVFTVGILFMVPELWGHSKSKFKDYVYDLGLQSVDGLGQLPGLVLTPSQSLANEVLSDVQKHAMDEQVKSIIQEQMSEVKK